MQLYTICYYFNHSYILTSVDQRDMDRMVDRMVDNFAELRTLLFTKLSNPYNFLDHFVHLLL